MISELEAQLFWGRFRYRRWVRAVEVLVEEEIDLLDRERLGVRDMVEEAREVNGLQGAQYGVVSDLKEHLCGVPDPFELRLYRSAPPTEDRQADVCVVR